VNPCGYPLPQGFYFTRHMHFFKEANNMRELIPINYEGDKPTVSGRELHAALEIETPYHKWFPRMCEYGFIESKDFWTFLSESSGGRPGTDHALTIPMAKELCMVQRTDKGKAFRQYFLEVEEAWNSPDKIMERALQIAHQRAVEAERRILGLEEEKETLEVALNESLQYWTVAKYNRHFMNMAWNNEDCKRVGKQLTAYCRVRAIKIRKCETNDERFGEVNSYPLQAWRDFLEGN
jgi:phage anti-repressor protein